MFFRKMNEDEKRHSAKGMQFGFLVYMMVTGTHYAYYTITEQDLISPIVLLLSGLIASFAYEAILNIKARNSR